VILTDGANNETTGTETRKITELVMEKKKA
jgi:hypothetical protein